MAHLSEPIELDLTDEQAFIVSVFIREGELRERERIIALLEERALLHKSDGEFFLSKQGDYSATLAEGYFEAIALIKGETE